jgi:predicted dehydrogenase|tara:strand:+ start:808 stop:1953 length:1146 start_codon:yes stop_codon:yes gene_type:complete
MKNIGLIGCGNIAETYFRSREYFNNITFISCADVNEEASKKCAEEYNIKAQSVDELLSNDDIDVVLNLTIPQAHFDVTKKILLANKHSYCEKPLSISFDQGKELVELAKNRNLYLGNAPDTFLGGGGQLARQKIDDAEIGKILTGNFIFAFPGVQTFHPNPESWFRKGGGPVIDMGPYFFTTLVNLLGPAKNVRARGKKFTDQREFLVGPKKGQMFDIEILTSVMFDVEFHNETIIQGFISFDVENHGRNHMELYGTKGSIVVPDPNMFGGPVIISKELGTKWQEYSVENKYLGKTNIINSSVRSNETSKQANYRGIGLSEMIYSIENNLEHRCNGELALHVLDLIESTIKSAEKGIEVDLQTTCKRPTPFTEDEIKTLIK